MGLRGGVERFRLARRPPPRYRVRMTADRGERARDERGRYAPKEGAEPEPTEEKPREADTTTQSGISAPSIGPKTVIDRQSADERLAKHEQSDVDAMGLDKRREVVGKSYGPSFAKQATLYGGFLALVVAAAFGFVLLTDRLDQPAEEHRNEASWAQPGAPQLEPAPLDSPRNGSPDAGL
jgi:hypothetical protein